MIAGSLRYGVSSCDIEERDVSFEGGVEEIGGKRDTLAHNWKVYALSGGCGIGACWPRARSLDYIKSLYFPNILGVFALSSFPSSSTQEITTRTPNQNGLSTGLLPTSPRLVNGTPHFPRILASNAKQ
jgi:hypothetical protein